MAMIMSKTYVRDPLTPITMAGIHWITFVVFRVETQWILSLVHHSSQSLLNLLRGL